MLFVINAFFRFCVGLSPGSNSNGVMFWPRLSQMVRIGGHPGGKAVRQEILVGTRVGKRVPRGARVFRR